MIVRRRSNKKTALNSAIINRRRMIKFEQLHFPNLQAVYNSFNIESPTPVKEDDEKYVYSIDKSDKSIIIGSNENMDSYMIKLFKKEVKFAIYFGNGQLEVGPKVYRYGLINIGDKSRTFIVVDKIMPLGEGVWCVPKIQEEFVQLYMKMSKHSIIHGESSPDSFMLNNGKLVIIDYSFTRRAKNVGEATRENLNKCIWLAGVDNFRYGIFNGACEDCTPFLNELKKYAKPGILRDLNLYGYLMINGEYKKIRELFGQEVPLIASRNRINSSN